MTKWLLASEQTLAKTLQKRLLTASNKLGGILYHPIQNNQLKRIIMELKKEDIYGELKWVYDCYGKFEVLVDTEFMSINNPLIRLQIEKRFKNKRE